MSGALTEEHAAAIQAAVAKALSEAGSRNALLADPQAALAAAGVALPPGTVMRVTEGTPGSFEVRLQPAGPTALSDQQLDAVNGGWVGRDSGAGFTYTNSWGIFMNHTITTGYENPVQQTNAFGTLKNGF